MKRLLLLTAALGMLLASPAMAQSGADGGFNCVDFPDQESAQLFLDSDPSDPEGLDADGDGLACEDELPSSGVDPIDGTESFIVTTAQTGNNCPEPFVSNFDPNDPATAETFTCIAPGDVEVAPTEVVAEEPMVEEPVAAAAASQTMTDLPDTGGASLIALGAGALLVAGGLLIRRR
jgi:LPXTG-motif cell wall-anchored protein